jgi:hypothetical protein
MTRPKPRPLYSIWLYPNALALALVAIGGCASQQEPPACPDISGRYANEGSGTNLRLASLLMPDADRLNNVKTVALALKAEQLEVAVAGHRTLLRQGEDFTCTAAGLRLVEPTEYGLDLGEALVHGVKTFRTLKKETDGSLVATEEVEERASVGTIPLPTQRHAGKSTRWRGATAGSL